MSEVDISFESKRRLPSWMLGVTAADKLKKSQNEDENLTSAEEQSSIQTACPKAKPITRRLKQVSTNEKAASEVDLASLLHRDKAEKFNGVGEITWEQAAEKSKNLAKHGTDSREEIEENVTASENGALEVNSGTLIWCVKRIPTSKKRKQDEDKDTSITSSSVAGKQKKKVKTRIAEDKTTAWKHSAPKKGKLKKYGTPSTEDTSSSSTEGIDDEDLTVEDLMSMAEEYVKASEKENLQTAMQEPKSSSQFLSTDIISTNESGGSPQANRDVQEISSCRMTGSNPDSAQTERKDNESLPSGITVPSSRTGDPAQDMLELLLGPLLKKPEAEKRTLDLLKEDMTRAGEFKKDVTSQVRVEQEAPLTKKKSSLKDKVAMFLD